MKCLKNYGFIDAGLVDQPICIKETDQIWAKAYANWRAMKKPTDDIAWDRGIFFGDDEEYME
jgi:hypothetical protein